ncbi:hypothetical protein D3C85_1942750 [compost metagenome]
MVAAVGFFVLLELDVALSVFIFSVFVVVLYACLEVIVIYKVFAGVIWRVDVDHLYFAEV